MTTDGESAPEPTPAPQPAAAAPAPRPEPLAATPLPPPGTPTAPAVPTAVPQPTSKTVTRRAAALCLLALLNVIGAALLFYAVSKGQEGVRSGSYCPHSYPAPAVPGSVYPGDPGGTWSAPGQATLVTPGDCDKPFAKPFVGLGLAPVTAVLVSGFLMSVLYDRRQKRLAVLQTGFFVLSLAYAVYGATSLVDYWL